MRGNTGSLRTPFIGSGASPSVRPRLIGSLIRPEKSIAMTVLLRTDSLHQQVKEERVFYAMDVYSGNLPSSHTAAKVFYGAL